MTTTRPPLRDQVDIDLLERVPLADRLERPISSYAAIARQAANAPMATAITFVPTGDPDDGEQRYTYAMLLARITQVANALHGLGVQRGDVVSYMLPNLPETHFTLWGAEAVGIVNPINPFLEVDHIAGILNAAGTRVLVALGRQTTAGVWEKVEALRAHVPSLEAIVRIGGIDACPEWAQDFDAWLAKQPTEPQFRRPEAHGSDIASYFHTGGTTGTPKLARRSHFNESANAWGVTSAVDMGPQDTVLCGLPLFHSNAMMVTGLAPFSVGAHVVLLSDAGYRSPKTQASFWRSVQRYRATLFSAVPTVLSALLNVPRDGVDLSSLRFAICGAAPLSPELFQRFERASGLKLLEGYGMTEATCVSSINPRDGERPIGSIGLRLPYQEMKIVQLHPQGEIDRECDVDEIGTVVLRGPYVFSGYVKASDNKNVCLADGWLNTGDLGRRDANGYFWLTGRAKDLIIRGGHNIDPAMIEEGLMRHPAVDIAAAVGIPDGHAGELPMAYVTLRAGTHASAEELLTHARSAITERAAIPVQVLVLEAMPLTAVNKIFKPALREMAIAKALTDTVQRVCGSAAKVDVDVRPHPKLGLESHVTVVLADVENRGALIAQTEAELGRLPVRWVARWSKT
ncbi:acyl-CoA synthetase [Paraburkholderia flava]|uniref:acyl-CoA synthetase n=1 Tax=Paraburkholderia flava TaxID=2547393 RepID=UPI00105D130F|nr:acyl-CoA synthetase [Paraburkholderia flava]